MKTIEIRAELLRFAEAMELVLRKNDHKGATDAGMRPNEALDRMWDEIRELDRASYGHPNIFTKPARLRQMQRESVDVANFAMMFWLGCESWIKDEDMEE